MRQSWPNARPHHLATLLGSGVVVVVTGWVGPTDGAVGAAHSRPCGTAVWDQTALLAQVLMAAAPSEGPFAQGRVLAELPDAVAQPLHRRAMRRGPVRLGLTLPPWSALRRRPIPRTCSRSPPPQAQRLTPVRRATPPPFDKS